MTLVSNHSRATKDINMTYRQELIYVLSGHGVRTSPDLG